MERERQNNIYSNQLFSKPIFAAFVSKEWLRVFFHFCCTLTLVIFTAYLQESVIFALKSLNDMHMNAVCLL